MTKIKRKAVIIIIVGYCRVSTAEQNMSRQEVTMKEYNVEKVFAEKISGKDTNRPKLQELLEFVREGDTVVVHDFSRLARSTIDLLSIVELLKSKGVTLISSKENFDTSTSSGMLMISLIGCINSFQRVCILENQREGIAIAKAQGKYKGRKPIEVEDFDIYYDEYMSRKISKGKLAKKLGVSRPTLNKLFAEYEKTHAATEKTAI